eukprot:scaffold244879_cov31-Prasinocladus_malaysianus.AAC.1
MRRTRFFASVRSSINALRSTVVGKLEAYCAPPDGDDEDNTVLVSGGGTSLFSEEREELRRMQEAKTAQLMADVELAFQVFGAPPCPVS